MQPAAASADGDTGLVPAPKAGQHNAYLRGDGKWIQANNAPTAAQFAYATTTETVSTVSGNSMVPSGWYFPFNVTNIIGNYITSKTIPYATNNKSTTFTLAPNSTYKCSFSLGGYNDYGGNPLPQNIYGWYNITTGTAIGVFATQLGQTNTVATGVVTASSVPTVIGVMFSYSLNNSVTIVPYGLTPQYGWLNSWATIEMLSTGNAISPFGGATSNQTGTPGYVPAPLAGQQEYILTGNGTWRQSRMKQYILGVGTDNNLYRKKINSSLWGTWNSTRQCCVLSACQLQDGTFLGVGLNNGLYTLANLNAGWIYGGDNTKAVIGITQMNDGKLLGVGTDYNLYTKTTLTAPWISVPSSGTVKCAIQLQDGRIVGIGTDNAMWIRANLTAGWVYGGDNTKPVISITQLQDGSFIGVGTDSKLYSLAHMQANWVNGGDNTCCVKCIVAILM